MPEEDRVKSEETRADGAGTELAGLIDAAWRSNEHLQSSPLGQAQASDTTGGFLPEFQICFDGLSSETQKSLDYARRNQHIDSVPEGASLYNICRAHLQGKGEKSSPAAIWTEVKRIAGLNKIDNPDLIVAGEKLKLEDELSLRSFEQKLRSQEPGAKPAFPPIQIDGRKAAVDPYDMHQGPKDKGSTDKEAETRKHPETSKEPEAGKDPQIEKIDSKYPFNVAALKVSCRYDQVFLEAKQIFQEKQSAGKAPGTAQLFEQARAAAVPGQRYFQASVPYWASKDGSQALGENYMWDQNGKLISQNYWRRGGGDQLGHGKTVTVYHNIEGVNAGGSDIGWINQSTNEKTIAGGGNPPIDMHGRSLSSGSSRGCEAHPSSKDYPNWLNFRDKMHHAILDNQKRGLRPMASLHVGTEYAVRSSLEDKLDKFHLSEPKLVPLPRPGGDESIKPPGRTEPVNQRDTRSWSESQKKIVSAAEAAMHEKMWRYAGWSDDSVDGGNLGCAASISGILRLAGYNGSLSAGANELGRLLQKEGSFSRVFQKEDLRAGRLRVGDIRPGDIIVWQPGEGGHGHIGTVIPGDPPGVRDLDYMKKNRELQVKSNSQSLKEIARDELKRRHEKFDSAALASEVERLAVLNNLNPKDRLRKTQNLKIYDEKFIADYEARLPERALSASATDGLDFIHNSSGKRMTVRDTLESRLKDDRHWYLLRPAEALPAVAAVEQPRIKDYVLAQKLDSRFSQISTAMKEREKQMTWLAAANKLSF